MHPLKVSKTKLTSVNSFIVDHFALGGKQKSKYDEKTFYCSSPQSFNLSVKP